MKRTIMTLLFTAALLLTVGVVSSFANGGGSASDIAGARFHKDFHEAEMLTSASGENYTRITFRMNGMILTAYYSHQGELLALTHNIRTSELPLSLLLPIRRDYKNFWISDLFEFNAGNESTYYITLENADKKIILRSSDGAWTSYNKTVKP